MTGDTDIDRDTALIALFEASRARLFSLAYRILGVRADAEDVVQDTFVKWHLHHRTAGIAGGDALDAPAAWLATVAKRTAIDRLRRLKHEAPMPGGIDNVDGFNAIDHAPSPQTLAEQTSDLSYGMRLVLDRLSAEERAAFLLREAFEADYASIAKILNRSAAHCRQMVHRAKDRVRDDRKNKDAAHTVRREDAIEPAIESLLDAIARQDVSALVALTLATAPEFAPVSQIAATAIAEQQAALLTHALIARLRMGRIDLPASVDYDRVSLSQPHDAFFFPRTRIRLRPHFAQNALRGRPAAGNRVENPHGAAGQAANEFFRSNRLVYPENWCLESPAISIKDPQWLSTIRPRQSR